MLQVEAVLQSLNSILLEKQASTEEEWTQLGMPSSGKIFIWNISKVCEGHIKPFTEKEVFFFMSCMWDKEKILSSSHEELNLRPLDSSL